MIDGMERVPYVHTLTRDELACAALVAEIRNKLNDGSSNLAAGEHMTKKELFENDENAVRAEIACARLLNLAWTGCGPQDADVGGFVEVRSVTNRGYSLTVNAKEIATKRGQPFALLLVDGARCEFMGWEFMETVVDYGRCMNPGPKAYHLLGQERLRHMEELVAYADSWRWHRGLSSLDTQEREL